MNSLNGRSSEGQSGKKERPEEFEGEEDESAPFPCGGSAP